MRPTRVMRAVRLASAAKPMNISLSDMNSLQYSYCVLTKLSICLIIGKRLVLPLFAQSMHRDQKSVVVGDQ